MISSWILVELYKNSQKLYFLFRARVFPHNQQQFSTKPQSAATAANSCSLWQQQHLWSCYSQRPAVNSFQSTTKSLQPSCCLSFLPGQLNSFFQTIIIDKKQNFYTYKLKLKRPPHPSVHSCALRGLADNINNKCKCVVFFLSLKQTIKG